MAPHTSPIPAHPQIMPMPAGPRSKHHFAEQAEQNLRRAAAGRPSDRHQADPQNQRRGAHVAQAFGVLVPRPRDFVLAPDPVRSARNPFSTRRCEMHHAEKRNEIALNTNASLYPNAVTEAPPRNDPMVTVVHCVSCVKRIRRVQFVFGRDRRKNRRPAAGEEWRREHQRAAQDVEQPRAPVRNRENEQQRDHGAHQVAGDHDALPVQPVEQHARDRARPSPPESRARSESARPPVRSPYSRAPG